LPRYPEIDCAQLDAGLDFDSRSVFHVSDTRIKRRSEIFLNAVLAAEHAGLCGKNRPRGRARIQVITAGGYPEDAVLTAIVRCRLSRRLECSLASRIVCGAQKLNL